MFSFNNKSVTAELAAFDFNKPDLAYLDRQIFSHYGKDIAKAAGQAREIFETIAMYPQLAVECGFAVAIDGDAVSVAEELSAYFRRDNPESPIVTFGVSQTPGVNDPDSKNQSEPTYLNKVALLEVFDAFAAKYKGTKFISGDGHSAVEFVGIANKLRVFLQLLDDRVCQFATNIDHDEAEPALYITVKYDAPEALMAIVLYGK